YAGTTVTTTDADQKSKMETRDLLGNIVKVTEYADGGATYETNYSYSPAGDLMAVTAGADTVVSYTYDLVGRRRTMSHRDMGKWQYTYDVDGTLKTQTDAKGQVITMDYDGLHRMRFKSYPAGSGQSNVQFVYDDALVPNSRGRLTRVSNGTVISSVNS